MRTMSLAATVALSLLQAIGSASADDLACVSTTFRLIGKNDRVCVSAFDDPKVPGVACHVSQARTRRVEWHHRSGRRPIALLYCLSTSRPDHRRLCDPHRPGRGLFGAHVDFLQAHARLPNARPEAKHADLPRHQRQTHRRLAAEFDLYRAGHALGDVPISVSFAAEKSPLHHQSSSSKAVVRRPPYGLEFKSCWSKRDSSERKLALAVS